MSETTEQEPVRPEETDWLVGPEPAGAPMPGSPRGGRRAAAAAAGLVAAGALVGGVGVTAFRSHGSTPASSTSFTPGGLPGGGQGPAGGGQGLAGAGQGPAPGQGVGGVAGEQRLAGTVTAVGASTVTIRTASGTASYAVTAQSEIVRNGAAASLSAVRAGDSVFVHLVPGNGGSYVVERLFAQSSAST